MCARAGGGVGGACECVCFSFFASHACLDAHPALESTLHEKARLLYNDFSDSTTLDGYVGQIHPRFSASHVLPKARAPGSWLLAPEHNISGRGRSGRRAHSRPPSPRAPWPTRPVVRRFPFRSGSLACARIARYFALAEHLYSSRDYSRRHIAAAPWRGGDLPLLPTRTAQMAAAAAAAVEGPQKRAHLGPKSSPRA